MSGAHRGTANGAHRGIASFGRRDAILAVVNVLLVAAAVVGLVTLRHASTPSATPPTPPSPSPTVSIGTSKPQPPKHVTKKVVPIKCSHPAATGGDTPLRVCIPSLRVDASVMSLGLNADRTVQVPPLSRVGDAGWYKYSAQPGAVGPTVILGHVDSAQYGEGVFYRLGTLRSGDQIMITRGDGKIAVYRIVRVDEVSKKHFPTDSVYGATSGPAIRLVTCGGKFDAASGNYLDNIIAYGTLSTVRRAA